MTDSLFEQVCNKVHFCKRWPPILMRLRPRLKTGRSSDIYNGKDVDVVSLSYNPRNSNELTLVARSLICIWNMPLYYLRPLFTLQLTTECLAHGLLTTLNNCCTALLHRIRRKSCTESFIC